MALDPTARPAEDGYLLVQGLAKDRRLLTGSADEVHLSPPDPADSDEIGLSPTTGPTSSDEVPLLVNDPPGSAEEGHRFGFGFETTTTTAGPEGHGFGLVVTTTRAGSEEDELGLVTTTESAQERHGLVTPVSLSSSN